MKNEDAVIDPINYLEMIFGRFVADRQDLEIRQLNYFCFLEVVNAFTSTGTFKDSDQYYKACEMRDRLKQVLDIDFTKKPTGEINGI